MKKTSALLVALAMLFSPTIARAGGWHGFHHHHNDGLGIALGVTGALVGTALLVDAFSRPYYAVPPPAYYYPPPPQPYYGPPPAAYQTPPTAAYPPTNGAYAEGYRAGLAEAGRRQALEERVDYGLDTTPYYRRR